MALTQVNAGLIDSTSQPNSFKNRIINGHPMIDQRNAGASVTQGTSSTYSVDRWYGIGGISGKFTLQQNAGSVTPPVGYKNYLGCTSTSAFSVGAGDAYAIGHAIEGYNIADLAWGTANAKAVTLSFQVYSSLTGTFGGAINNGTFVSATRSYPFSYSIPAANTWTTVTITVPGDTAGTWATSNALGLSVFFGMGVSSAYSGTTGSWAGAAYCSATGATSVVGTNGATFYITGVQLEKGSTATSFDYRPYGTELALCQRYYVQATEVAVMSNINTRYLSTTTRLNPVPMRTTPTLAASGTYTFNPFFGTSAYTSSNTPTLQRNLNDNFIVNFDMGSSTGSMGFGEVYNATISLSAEL